MTFLINNDDDKVNELEAKGVQAAMKNLLKLR